MTNQDMLVAILCEMDDDDTLKSEVNLLDILEAGARYDARWSAAYIREIKHGAPRGGEFRGTPPAPEVKQS